MLATRHSSLVSHHLSPASLILLFAGICLWGSCAAEAPPRPPRLQIPVRVTDLTAAQIGRTIRLTFDLPRLALDGRRLTKPVEAEIFRSLAPPAGTFPRPSLGAAPWISLSPAALAGIKRGSSVVYDNPLSAPAFRRAVGTRLSFTVITLTRGFRHRPLDSGPSNAARMELLDVSPPIEGLRAVHTPRGLHLQWSQPTRGLAGGPLPSISGYRVYRSANARRGSFLLLAQTLKPEYNDTDFQFGQAYYYRVQATFDEQGYMAASAESLPVGITPRDIFPPPVPLGLTAVSTGRGVELIWKADASSDLAGYNIYRQAGNGRPERLNAKVLAAPAFSDSTARPNEHYVYWVTAVSLAGNESKPSAKVIVDTRQPAS